MKRPTPWYVGLARVAWPAVLLYAVALGWFIAEATRGARECNKSGAGCFNHPTQTAKEVKNIGIVR
jgi:hypothetical protein